MLSTFKSSSIPIDMNKVLNYFYQAWNIQVLKELMI